VRAASINSAIRGARAGGGRAPWRGSRAQRAGDPRQKGSRVGGHLYGRFCRRVAPPPRGPHGEPGGPEVGAGRLAPHARRLLDAPERPAQPPKCENLLPFVVAQDVGHAGEWDHSPSRRVNVLSAYSLWPVLRCRPMAGFGCRPKVGSRRLSVVRPAQGPAAAVGALGPPPAAPAAGRETFFDFSAIHLLTDDEYTRPAARTRPEEAWSPSSRRRRWPSAPGSTAPRPSCSAAGATARRRASPTSRPSSSAPGRRRGQRAPAPSAPTPPAAASRAACARRTGGAASAAM